MFIGTHVNAVVAAFGQTIGSVEESPSHTFHTSNNIDSFEVA